MNLLAGQQTLITQPFPQLQNLFSLFQSFPQGGILSSSENVDRLQCKIRLASKLNHGFLIAPPKNKKNIEQIDFFAAIHMCSGAHSEGVQITMWDQTQSGEGNYKNH